MIGLLNLFNVNPGQSGRLAVLQQQHLGRTAGRPPQLRQARKPLLIPLTCISLMVPSLQ